MEYNNIKRAKEHLYAALAQVIDKDDKIIVDHMKAAYELLDATDDCLKNELLTHKRVMEMEAPFRDGLNALLDHCDAGGLLLEQAVLEIIHLRSELVEWKKNALSLAELPYYMRLHMERK